MVGVTYIRKRSIRDLLAGERDRLVTGGYVVPANGPGQERADSEEVLEPVVEAEGDRPILPTAIGGIGGDAPGDAAGDGLNPGRPLRGRVQDVVAKADADVRIESF